MVSAEWNAAVSGLIRAIGTPRFAGEMAATLRRLVHFD